jgi:hypothetical protein
MSSRFDLAHLQGNRVITPHTWIHVAATFDTAVARLYVNGVLDSTQTPAAGRIHSGTTDVIIGSMYSTANEPVDLARGLVDELCLYNRALAPSEINAIYLAGAAGKIKPATAIHGEERRVREATAK